MNMLNRILLVCLAAGWVQTADANVLTINSSGDDGLAASASTTCDTGNTVSIPGVGDVPECTLRAAVEALWNSAGSGTIEYASALECSDLNVIQLTSGDPLLPLRNPVTVVGESHPCADDDGEDHYPLVFMPASAGSADYGLQVEGGDSLIENMAFSGFDTAGIIVRDGGNTTLREIESSFNALYGVIFENVTGGRLEHSTIESQIPEDANNVGLFSSQGVVLTNNQIRNAGQHGIFFGAGSGSNSVGVVTGTPPNQFCPGNEIRDNAGAGIMVASGDENIIQCNEIRDNEQDGVRLESDGTLVGSAADIGVPDLIHRGNQVLGNGEAGIRILGEASTIARNLVGGADGDPDDGNSMQGIVVAGGADDTTQVQENTIRYNDSDGIRVLGQGRGTIRGNLITSNGANGIRSLRNPVTIGGEEEEEANVIVENATHGIEFVNAEGTGFPSIGGNFIGTDPDFNDLGNGAYGIYSDSTDTLLRVGSLAVSGTGRAPNVIGFNGSGGIQARDSDEVRIINNYIGTNSDGQDLGNAGPGVTLLGSGGSGGRVGHQPSAVISPPIESDGNVIAFNSGAGVQIEEGVSQETVQVPIRGNSIHSNAGRGIDLGPDGDVVDPGGGDTGPNNQQNFPEFIDNDTYYDQTAGEVVFNYRIRTNTGNASYPLRVDFYLVDGTDSQGRTWIGTDSYSSGSANSYHSGSFEPAAWAGAIEGHITATATDDDGNTSEFNPNPVALEQVDQDDEIFHDRFEDGNGGGGECAGNCGGMADSGCFCDEGCEGFGDCCDDVCVDCPELSHCESLAAPSVNTELEHRFRLDPEHSAVRPDDQ